ncbi:MAG TPA: hypothetical protein VHX49_10805 [Candidatus Acidoferrales bacterium]|jgi:hypothetical protein|nr:hypothetical protein [Candidatus Acidoferrales bacterium]
MNIPAFDIFEVEADGSVLWRESATTIEEAKARGRELAAASPGEYFILSHRTGSRLKIEPDGSRLETPPSTGQEA